ncbi:MAG TPA: hypothetical protein VGR57_21605 [Ktedonobacterales bacterium]|nr:hypothetical protein [Ktedonobacterales bacterium]
MSGTRTRPGRSRTITGRASGARGALSIIALLILAMAGCGASSASPAAVPTPTPLPTATIAPDPATLAYVNAWRDAYNAMRVANQVDQSCATMVIVSGSVQDFLACKDPFEKLVTAATALKAQLNATPPPARWQAQHTALLQAVQAMIAVNNDLLVLIANQDIASFLGPRDRIHAMYQSFCAPIRQLNDGPPPLAPKLVVPDPEFCVTPNG